MAKSFFSDGMKSLLLTLLVAGFCLSAQNSFAYLSEIKILEKKEIVKLSDEILSSSYLDTIIELEAINLYHRTGGFTPKEYQQYKDLLRFEYELKSELQRRQLDIPSIVRTSPQ